MPRTVPEFVGLLCLGLEQGSPAVAVEVCTYAGLLAKMDAVCPLPCPALLCAAWRSVPGPASIARQWLSQLAGLQGNCPMFGFCLVQLRTSDRVSRAVS